MVEGFKKVFNIPIVSPVNGLHIFNNSSVGTYDDHATKLIDTEFKHGRITGPFNDPPFPNFMCSPIGLHPKKEQASFQIIHNLSFSPHTPGLWIPAPPKSAVRVLGRGEESTQSSIASTRLAPFTHLVRTILVRDLQSSSGRTPCSDSYSDCAITCGCQASIRCCCCMSTISRKICTTTATLPPRIPSFE